MTAPERLEGLRNFAGAWLNSDMVPDYGDARGALLDYVEVHRRAPRLLVRFLQDVEEVLSWGIDGPELAQRLGAMGIDTEVWDHELLPFLVEARRAAATALVDGPEER